MWPSTCALSVETCDRPNHHLRTPSTVRASTTAPMTMKTLRRELVAFAGAAALGAGEGRAGDSVSGSIVVAIVLFLNAGSARCPPTGPTQSVPILRQTARRCPHHGHAAMKPGR